MQVQPYLSFEGRCEEAIEFYRKALGAEVQQLMRFNEAPGGGCPEGSIPPGTGGKVMHSCLKIGETSVMMTDGRMSESMSFKGIALALQVANQAEAVKFFTALADGGQVTMPGEKTFWSPWFGMVTDRFGVSWMVNANG